MALKSRSKRASNAAGDRTGFLNDHSDREALRRAYRHASTMTRASAEAELRDLDHLAGESLGEL
jgi:hypothetical protein